MIKGWRKASATTKSSTPRFLTKREIEDIISIVPPMVGPIKEASEFERKQMRSYIKKQLKKCKIVPEAIPALKQNIISTHYRSLIDPGTPIGVNTCEGAGAAYTQAVLNTFHNSGAMSSATSAIANLTGLINTSREIRNAKCTVHFKNKEMDFEEVLNMRIKLTGITVDKLIDMKSIKIIDRREYSAEEFWLNENYNAVIGKEPPEGKNNNYNFFMRLQVKVDEMYKYRIRMDELARKIQNNTVLAIKDMDSELIRTYHSGFADGIIDIVPISTNINKYLQKIIGDENKSREKKGKEKVPDLLEEYESAFLLTIVMPNFEKVMVKGIKRLGTLFPISESILTLVKEQERVTAGMLKKKKKFKKINIEDLDNVYVLGFNLYKLQKFGIGISRYVKIANLLGIEVIAKGDKWLMLRYPKGVNSFAQHVSEQTNQLKKSIQDGKIENTGENSLLVRLVWYHYAEIQGDNMRDLMVHPDIDGDRVWCNNIHVIYQTLGIEASRKFFLIEYGSLLGAPSSALNPSYIFVFASYVTMRGFPAGFTYVNLAGQRIGAISTGLLEKAKKVIKSHALAGNNEETTSMAPAIAAGTRAKIGTGSFTIAMKVEDVLLIENETIIPSKKGIKFETIEYQEEEPMSSIINIHGNANTQSLIGDLDLYKPSTAPVIEQLKSDALVEAVSIQKQINEVDLESIIASDIFENIKVAESLFFEPTEGEKGEYESPEPIKPIRIKKESPTPEESNFDLEDIGNLQDRFLEEANYSDLE